MWRTIWRLLFQRREVSTIISIRYFEQKKGNLLVKTPRCGNTSAECGIGNCQSGKCQETSPPSRFVLSSTPALFVLSSSSNAHQPTPRPSPYSPSPDGSCGFKNKYVCNGTEIHYGYCCSVAGYCGTSQYHCNSLQGW